MTLNSELFFQAVETRRSIYAIRDASPISDAQLRKLVERAVKHAPSSFNSQPGRAVVVTGEYHRRLWDAIKALKTKGQSEEHARATIAKLDGFKAGYGSVLFFNDNATTKGMGEKFPALAQAFETWGTEAAGILEYIVWTALEREGLGASLQHSAHGSPEVNEAILGLFDLPATWQSTAIMPFGTPTAEPREKAFLPIEDRVRVFFDSETAETKTPESDD